MKYIAVHPIMFAILTMAGFATPFLLKLAIDYFVKKYGVKKCVWTLYQDEDKKVRISTTCGCDGAHSGIMYLLRDGICHQCKRKVSYKEK